MGQSKNSQAQIIRKQSSFRELMIRWSFFVIGLIILAFGISLTIQAEMLGIGPWDVFHVGLNKQFGLTVGTWSIIAGIVVVGFTSAVTKSFPQIGTILNMLLIGVFIDVFLFILPDPQAVWTNIVVFVLGVVVLAYGIGIYVAPELGAGPRDGLMLVIRDLTGLSVQWVRNGIEIIVFLLGWMLGGPVGVGTIFIAFFLGTIVGYSLPQSKKLLDYCIQRGERDENLNKRSLRSNHHDRSSQKIR
ncbi:YczE/YyaS/YitT family protein [Pontibacillus yanchengensis]|uniref:Membrane protein n=1 Tax=Pontibacillus yanchengensis Y32 TaxID=1385514 RepID=A0A0A2T9P5_9BACI|nr:YitT family protein [Pontibacillus yanchengensis]KGP71133.1 membrane protein [Pontibacillus yanchengensis Y32]